MHTMFFLLIYTPFSAKSLQAELLEPARGYSAGHGVGNLSPGEQGDSHTQERLLRKAAALGHICLHTPSLMEVLTAKTWGKPQASEHRDTSPEHPAAAASTLPSSCLTSAQTFFPCICPATAEPTQAFSSQKMVLQGASQTPCIHPQ